MASRDPSPPPALSLYSLVSLGIYIWAVSRVVSVAVAVWPGRALVMGRGLGKNLPLKLACSM